MQRALLTLAAVAICVSGLQADDKKPKQKPQPKPKVIKKRARAIRIAAPGVVLRRGNYVYHGPNKLYLLRRPDIGKELKLEEDQKKEATEAITEINKNRREAYKKLRGAGAKDRFKKYQELTKKFNDQSDEKAKEILKEEQYKRLNEIAVQMQGINAFRNPEILKKLKVSEDQKKEFKEAQEETRQARLKLSQDIRNGNIARAKYREESQKLQKKLEKKMVEVLNKEQQDQFAKMKGKKFEIKRPTFRAVPGIRLNGAKIKIKRIKNAKPIKRARPKKAKKAKQAKPAAA